MVMASAELDEVRATVRVVRPPKTTMNHPDALGQFEMLEDLTPILVADMNLPPAVPDPVAPAIPIWSNFFDYYDLDPIKKADVGGQPIDLTQPLTVIDGDPSS